MLSGQMPSTVYAYVGLCVFLRVECLFLFIVGHCASVCDLTILRITCILCLLTYILSMYDIQSLFIVILLSFFPSLVSKEPRCSNVTEMDSVFLVSF